MKLSSIRPPPGTTSHKLAISTEPHAPNLALEQLTIVRSLVNDSLDIIDVSTWTGDPNNADFIAGQLRLLFDHVQEAKQTLKGQTPTQKAWWEDPIDDKVCIYHNFSKYMSCSTAMNPVWAQRIVGIMCGSKDTKPYTRLILLNIVFRMLTDTSGL